MAEETTEPQIPAGYVSPEDLAAGYVTKESHNAILQDSIQHEVKKRLANHVARDKAADDAGIIQAVLEKHGKAKPGEIDLKPHFEAWDKEHAQPWRDKAAKYERQARRGAILQAATDHHVDERFTASTGPGDPSYIEILLQGKLAEHDRYGYVVKDGDDYMPSGNPDRPYANLGDLLAKWQADPDRQYLFKKEKITANGQGYQGGGGATPAKRKRSEMTPADKAAFFEEMRAQGKDPTKEFFALPE